MSTKTKAQLESELRLANLKVNKLEAKVKHIKEMQSGEFIHLYDAVNVSQIYLKELINRTTSIRIQTFHEVNGDVTNVDMRIFQDGNRACIMCNTTTHEVCISIYRRTHGLKKEEHE